MEVQVQSQQMVENITSDISDGLLRHAGKYSVSYLLEQRSSYSGCSICDDHRTSDRPCRAPNRHEVDVHGVHNALKVERYLDVENLGAHEQAQSRADAHFGAHVSFGPQVLDHFLHDGNVNPALLLRRQH